MSDGTAASTRTARVSRLLAPWDFALLKFPHSDTPVRSTSIIGACRGMARRTSTTAPGSSRSPSICFLKSASSGAVGSSPCSSRKAHSSKLACRARSPTS